MADGEFTSDVLKKVFAAIISSAILFLGGWFWQISAIVAGHSRDIDEIKPILNEVHEVQREIAVIHQIQIQEQQIISEIRSDLRDFTRERRAKDDN